MLKIALCGCNGHIGSVISNMLKNDTETEISVGIDINTEKNFGYPVISNIEELKNYDFDVFVDFSHPSLLSAILKFITENKKPAVLATTGYLENDIENIKASSKITPIFFTANMSLGINLITMLAKKAAAILANDFDIEIIEKHHNQKIDAPSGTALMLAKSLNSVLGDKMQYEYDRHSKRAKRSKNEIGIHSVRGGTIPGEHEVIFAGNDEVITISHSALSKTVFASGAVKAAKYISTKSAGIYDMSDLLDL